MNGYFPSRDDEKRPTVFIPVVPPVAATSATSTVPPPPKQTPPPQPKETPPPTQQPTPPKAEQPSSQDFDWAYWYYYNSQRDGDRYNDGYRRDRDRYDGRRR
ncbi:hypothetical protein LWC34_47770 [Kibdelosporangium philippinense]|uniref:Uncharacterized protein n=1 Tax=Kibdelosporangium philippinense TaxID=211113 RepID=A0ABS8ZX34_9PSEU|nr:hypothetical protein [Kibdelosporangium philippinense]MCE7010452.1 hypothetical protein [Kibdelosporangium philippinense]